MDVITQIEDVLQQIEMNEQQRNDQKSARLLEMEAEFREWRRLQNRIDYRIDYDCVGLTFRTINRECQLYLMLLAFQGFFEGHPYNQNAVFRHYQHTGIYDFVEYSKQFRKIHKLLQCKSVVFEISIADIPRFGFKHFLMNRGQWHTQNNDDLEYFLKSLNANELYLFGAHFRTFRKQIWNLKKCLPPIVVEYRDVFRGYLEDHLHMKCEIIRKCHRGYVPTEICFLIQSYIK